MTDTTFTTFRSRSLKSEKNLALIFSLLGLMFTALISLHWFLVLEPTLRTEAESRSTALAQAHLQGIEKLLDSDLSPEQLKRELQTALDAILLLKEQPTGTPFIRGIDLKFDTDFKNVPVDLTQGTRDCTNCFIVSIPLYHPRDHQLIGIATCYSNPWFFEHLIKDVRVKLLWVVAIILALIVIAWLETSLLLRRLSESESNLRNLFEAAPFPMMLHAPEQLGLSQANRAAKHFLGLSEDATGHFTSAPWLALHAEGLPTAGGDAREMLISVAGGAPHWALVSTVPLQFSGTASQLISLVDVTDMKRIQEELRAASHTDSLTGLYNRRYLFLRLTKEIDLVERYGHPLSIVLFDLDHFKNVNDTYGHGVGDEVLIQAAAALGACIREVDVAGRYGGEEFLLILPHSNAAEATDVAERIRVKLKGLTWSQPQLRVTISGGVHEYRGEALDQFIDAADCNLYRAKETGRDRVVA
jgi:diguanylate cyclase (GGDEF)-like protein